MSKPRQPSYVEPKRSHADVFVITHNEHATNLFGCNLNATCGCNGGSVMCCTCCQSKGTQKEDNEHFGTAARKMISKMNQAQNDESMKWGKMTANVSGPDFKDSLDPSCSPPRPMLCPLR
jgi:hypothetical protein